MTGNLTIHDMDQLEELLRSSGRLDSSGKFTLSLADARAKLSQYSHTDPALWSLKIGQAFQLLDCSALHLEIQPYRWRFVGTLPARPLDPAQLQFLSSEFELTAENCLSMGALGLPSVSAQYSDAERTHVIVGQPAKRLSGVAGSLVVEIELREPYAFPTFLWRHRFALAKMSVAYGDHSFQVLYKGEPRWLEFFSTRTLSAQATGASRCPKEPAGRVRGTSTVFRAKEDGPVDCAVYVNDQLLGVSAFHPVQAGCLLEPFALPGFPDGLTVSFAADGLPTDISGLRLRDTPAFRHRLGEVLCELPRACQYLQNVWDHAPNFFRQVSTPVALDVFPGLMAVAGVMLATGIPTQPAFLFPTAIFWGLPGFYYWVSRTNRRKEFEQHLYHFRRQLPDWQRRVQEYAIPEQLQV